MGTESLQAACELAYSVARTDAESDYPTEPPSSMRSFLYVSDLPRRAITVAQQAVEDDSEFRAKVASQASEESVGRAGYLWLHRPPGWAIEFEDLTADVDEELPPPPGTNTSAFGSSDLGQDEEPRTPASGLITAVPDLPHLDASPVDLSLVGLGSRDADPEDSDVVETGLGVSDSDADSDADSEADTDSDGDSGLAAGSALAEGSDFTFDPGATFTPESPPFADAPMATVSPISGTEEPLLVPPRPSFETPSMGTAAVTDRIDYEDLDTTFTSIGDSDGVGLESELDYEADALESELSSLRGLVDRLAGERDSSVTSLPAVAPEELTTEAVSDRILEGELMALESDLDSARHELSLSQADLGAARNEREEAQRLHSDALKRQVELEKELASIREARMDVENQASEAQVSVISLEDKLSRVTSQLEEADRERNVIRSQLETMTSERNHIREDRALIKAERDDLSARMTEVEEKTGGADLNELMSSNKTMNAELETTSRELARMIAQAESFEEQIKTSTTAADGLRTEKIELTSRLADTELALETTRTQHEALKSDSERLAAEVGTLRAERDGLQSQLTELQASLADVLNEQAEIRQRNDSDRKSLNELRVERDVLMARMADLEQADREYEVKLKAMVRERDDLVTARDELIAERGQMRAEMAGITSNRDETIENLRGVEAKITPLETELQAERRQREELANRLLELDDIAERNAAELARLNQEREELSTTVEELRAERVQVAEIRVERDDLASKVAEADRRFENEDVVNRQKLTEMSDQLAVAEAARTSVEQRLSETLGELDTMRVEHEEVNKEVARLSAVEEALRAEAAASPPATAPPATPEQDATPESKPVAVNALADLAPPSIEDQAPATTVAEIEEAPAAAAGIEGIAPELGTVQPVGDISQEVPVVKLPPLGAPAPPDTSFDWPPPPGSDAEASAPSVVEPITAPTLPPADTITPASQRQDNQSAASDSSTAAASEPISTDVDDLDEVSELIAQTVSGFSDDPAAPSVLPDGDVAADTGVAGAAADAGLAAAGTVGAVADDLAPDDTTQVVPQISSAPPSIFGARSEATGEQQAPTDAARQAGSRRRQIEIPNDIMDDEIAVAQFVVSSPDVVLLVDGDSVAKLGWPSLPVAEQRDALVTYLADLSASSGAAPDVVFDGRIGDDDSLPASRAVRIRLSTPPTEPAAALDELVDAYPDQWPIALVTDDKDLADSAAGRGAAVLNNGQLLDLFIAQ